MGGMVPQIRKASRVIGNLRPATCHRDPVIDHRDPAMRNRDPEPGNGDRAMGGTVLQIRKARRAI